MPSLYQVAVQNARRHGLEMPDPADYAESDDEAVYDDSLCGWDDDGDHSEEEAAPAPTPVPTPVPSALKKLNTGKERRVSSCKKKKGKPSCRTCKAKKGEPCLGSSSSSADASQKSWNNKDKAEREVHVAADPRYTHTRL
jgi:hypothetical protein